MATDAGLPALSRRLSEIQALYTGDMTTAGHNVGKGARVESTAVARDVSGGDGRLSHMGRKGARLGMRYDVEDQGRRVVVKLVPPGPWVLMERGANAHTIPRSRSSRRRTAGVRYIHAPGYAHPIGRPVEHPGTKPGKRAITRAFGRVRARASRDFHEGYVDKLRKVMG